MSIHSFFDSKLRKNQTKTEVVVAVVRRVVVAIRHATIPRIAVPATTTVHTIGTTF